MALSIALEGSKARSNEGDYTGNKNAKEVKPGHDEPANQGIVSNKTNQDDIDR